MVLVGFFTRPRINLIIVSIPDTCSSTRYGTNAGPHQSALSSLLKPLFKTSAVTPDRAHA